MKEKIILAIKGFLIGVANIIPGVSGGTFALTLGIYEELIGTISHFFKNLQKNLRFIIPIAIGAVLSILIGSKVITKSLENFPFATTLFFIGLIVGGIPLLTNKIKKEKKNISNGVIFCLTFLFVLGLGLLKTNGEALSFSQIGIGGYFLLFFVGMIAAATMVIPGVSGSMVLMLLGYYHPIISTIEKLTHFKNIGESIMILLPFGIGILIGIVAIAKLIEFLLKKYEGKTYYGVLGFVMASVLTLLKTLFPIEASVLEIIVAILLLVIGFIIGYRLGDE